MVKHIVDPLFGTLTPDDDGFTGTFTALHGMVHLRLEGKPLEFESAAPRTAFIRWQEQESQWRLQICQSLLDLAQDWYEPEEGDPQTLTLERFQELIYLTELSIYPDGSTEAFYHDGEVFAGHSIIGEFDETGEFQSADICG